MRVFWGALTVIVIAVYIAVAGGVFYDVLEAPARVGSRLDRKSGRKRLEWIQQGKIHTQYGLESLFAAFIIALGGGGIILFDRSVEHGGSARSMIIGMILATAACCAYSAYTNYKMPG
mmetsp:Transcript_18552/g.31028  ORF Transcript_18552/g.31028 Transcript_18552/m.31028 type:complete len:118 (+) Transcript_18552:59-412(+)